MGRQRGSSTDVRTSRAWRRRIAAGAAVVATGAGGSLAAVAPAQAGGVDPTRLPAGSLQYSFVGCSHLLSRSPESLQPMIGYTSPEQTEGDGERSLGYDLKGGNAFGLLADVDDLRSAGGVSMQVSSSEGATGVAYVVFRPPALVGTDRVWVGRADLPAAGTGWQSVSAERTYTWRQFNLRLMRYATVAKPRDAGLAAFATRKRAGAGQVTLGYGCNGGVFNMDHLSGAGASYDLQGLPTTTTVERSVEDGATVFTPTVRDGAGAPVPDAGDAVSIERQEGEEWTAVTETTEPGTYRFVYAGRALYEGSVSDPITVGEPPAEEPTEEPSALLTSEPSESADPSPSSSADESTSTPPAAEPSGAASDDTGEAPEDQQPPAPEDGSTPDAPAEPNAPADEGKDEAEDATKDEDEPTCADEAETTASPGDQASPDELLSADPQVETDEDECVMAERSGDPELSGQESTERVESSPAP